MARAWFKYIGPPGCGSGILNSINYIYVSSLPLDCGNETENICAVSALYNEVTYGDHPAPFGNKLKSYITAACVAATAKPSAAGQKRYAYVKLSS